MTIEECSDGTAAEMQATTKRQAEEDGNEQPPAKRPFKVADAEKRNDDANSASATAASESMMDTLICSICQDILHDCVSLQPCMHAFCAGCYCPWMAALVELSAVSQARVGGQQKPHR